MDYSLNKVICIMNFENSPSKEDLFKVKIPGIIHEEFNVQRLHFSYI